MNKLNQHRFAQRFHRLAMTLALCLMPSRLLAQPGSGLASVGSILRDEPIKIDQSRAYATVDSPPGSAFRPGAPVTDSLIQQLANSSDGIVRLPPGDYAIPVRLY